MRISFPWPFLTSPLVTTWRMAKTFAWRTVACSLKGKACSLSFSYCTHWLQIGLLLLFVSHRWTILKRSLRIAIHPRSRFHLQEIFPTLSQQGIPFFSASIEISCSITFEILIGPLSNLPLIHLPRFSTLWGSSTRRDVKSFSSLLYPHGIWCTYHRWQPDHCSIGYLWFDYRSIHPVEE